MAIAGFGIGLALASSTVVTGLEIPPRKSAPAQAIVAQARLFGGSLGIATISVLLHNEINRSAQQYVSPELVAAVSQAATSLSGLLQQGCDEAFRNSMYISTGFSAVAVFASLIGYRSHHPNARQQRLDLVRTDADREVL
ncbi:hypothetical protein HIM_08529 [Hirsutella minnesotensis 3608]|uniref:Major facilitator superfamily (MFS) profile domain-containing protein n=1 Tax=Hirsutella minnesotensis 3608 TaxID=1043627 RepID=A0A0F8A3M2_9HYPO|nr:hypothetical protein HIM_08529 [Hirsutella minnesotensis 3608]